MGSRPGRRGAPRWPLIGLLALLLSACSSVGAQVSAPNEEAARSVRAALAPTVAESTTTLAPTTTTTHPPASTAFWPVDGSVDVPPNEPVAVAVEGGRAIAMQVTSPAGPVPGRFEGTRFYPDEPWEFGGTYSVSVVTENPDGERQRASARFSTIADAPTSDIWIYPDGGTVGIGMPVIVWFDEAVPAEHRAAIVEHLHVTTSAGAVEGAWRWTADDTLHWRPREFWPAHTQVTVEADLAGLPLGDSWFMQSWTQTFSIGQHQRITVDAASHQMVAYVDGQAVHTMAISTGSDQYPTASGIDLIMEKHTTFEMDSSSVGIFGAEAYRLVVDDAQRLTNSGTFIHAAPWNGLLGEANTSHGCVNASSYDAAWMMDFTQIGDPVEVVNTPERVSHTNGWGDWNLTWEEWIASSDV